MIGTVLAAVVASIAGLGVGFLLWAKYKTQHAGCASEKDALNQRCNEKDKEVTALQGQLERAEKQTATLKGDGFFLQDRCDELEASLRASQEKLSTFEVAAYNETAFQQKYEKLLKEHSVCADKVSELQRTKVELSFVEQKLKMALDKSKDPEAAGD